MRMGVCFFGNECIFICEYIYLYMYVCLRVRAMPARGEVRKASVRQL